MQSLKNEIHDLAEYLLRMPVRTDRQRWVKSRVVDLILDKKTIEELSHKYDLSPAILNPYLAELTENYESNL